MMNHRPAKVSVVRSGWLLVLPLVGVVLHQVPAAPGQEKPAVRQRRPIERDPRTFEGRRIADVMSYLGADWLMRPERMDEEQPERMLDALEIKEGMVVADVGAGVGFHAIRMGQRVGPKGVVYATDIQPEMIQMLVGRAETAGVNNVVPVLCSPTYTGLPPGALDLILMVDVYHEMAKPAESLKGLRQALKPGGRLVLVEFREEDPGVPIKPEHKMSVDQVRKEVEPAGFRFQKLLDFLPWQHILIFENPPAL